MTTIKNPNDIVSEIVDDYVSVFGDLLLGVVMYGSAVSHEYKPGISAINILLILTDNTIESLKRCSNIVQKWQKCNVSIPFFLTPAFIASAVDSYPVEFLDIQTGHRILMGDDYFSHLDFNRNNLRLQCERELRAVSIHLRRQFVGSAGKNSVLRAMMRKSMEKMLPVFKALLRMNDKSIPKIRSDVVMAIEDCFGLGASSFSGMLNLDRHGTKAKHYETLFDSFSATVDTLIERVGGLRMQ
jgi:hypothetical protein